MNKPRIFRHDGQWVVCYLHFHDALTGMRMFSELGSGSTIDEAWRMAYPKRTVFCDIFAHIFGDVPARERKTDPCDPLNAKPGGLPL